MYEFEFEWDEAKATNNFKKHQVTFSEASTLWLDSRKGWSSSYQAYFCQNGYVVRG